MRSLFFRDSLSLEAVDGLVGMSSFSKDVGEKGRGEGQRLETSGRVLASQQIHGRDTHG